MMVQLHTNHNYVNRTGVIDESPVHGRADVNPETAGLPPCDQETQIQKRSSDKEV